MALIMRCRNTNQELTCTWVELSASADNYRGELLGGLCCSLILKAATMPPGVYPQLPLLRHCDNMGVIKHGNAEFGDLRDKQVQADLICLMRSIDRTLPCPFRYEWILSHTDGKNKGACISTHMHKMNNRADALCKSALVDGIMANDYISSDFPFETIRVRAGTKKLTGSLRPFITSHHSRRVAKEVFGFGKRGKRLVNEDDFDLIFWDVIPLALKEFPSTFKDWLSKHVTGCCGVNRFLSKWEPGTTPTTAHPASATTKIFFILQRAWMRDEH
jgi:hypothetical protein